MPTVRLKPTWGESWGREAEAASASLPASDLADFSDTSAKSEACDAIMEVVRGSKENFLLLMAMVSNPEASVRELAKIVGLSKTTCHGRIVEIKVRLGRYVRFSQSPRRSKAA